jgi:hypothetical protein
MGLIQRTAIAARSLIYQINNGTPDRCRAVPELSRYVPEIFGNRCKITPMPKFRYRD